MHMDDPILSVEDAVREYVEVCHIEDEYQHAVRKVFYGGVLWAAMVISELSTLPGDELDEFMSRLHRDLRAYHDEVTRRNTHREN